MSITNTSLTTTAANIFAASSSSVITTIYVANYSTTTNASFSMFAVPSGGTANSRSIIYSNVTITAGDTYIINQEKLVLEQNESIRANANVANVCSVTVSYTNI